MDIKIAVPKVKCNAVLVYSDNSFLKAKYFSSLTFVSRRCVGILNFFNLILFGSPLSKVPVLKDKEGPLPFALSISRKLNPTTTESNLLISLSCHDFFLGEKSE